MGLVQPSNRREKICIFGPAKVGKSTCWLSIAKLAAQVGDSRKFYAIDTDDALGVLLDAKQYAGVNVELSECTDYPEIREASDKALASAEPGDFIVVDMVDKVYAWAQEYVRGLVSERATREASMEEAWAAGRKGWDLYGVDLDQGGWAVVNEKYFGVVKSLLLKSPAHIIFVAEEKEIPDAPKAGKEDPHARDRVEFGRFKPAGQKSLPYQVRSLLRVERLNRGRLITTFGDREREELRQAEYGNFAFDYLCKVGGWTVESPSS